MNYEERSKLDFVCWYSGMTIEKVEIQFNKYNLELL